jgi:hypothetical protein
MPHHTASPSPTLDNHNTRPAPERDARGRFVRGNIGGPGNPFARQTAALRKAFLSQCTEEYMLKLAATVMAKSLEGDMAAAKLALTYFVGKPTEATNPDRLDVEEWKLMKEGAITDVREPQVLARAMPVGTIVAPVKSVSDVLGARMGAFILQAMGFPEQARKLREEVVGTPDDPEWTHRPRESAPAEAPTPVEEALAQENGSRSRQTSGNASTRTLASSATSKEARGTRREKQPRPIADPGSGSSRRSQPIANPVNGSASARQLIANAPPVGGCHPDNWNNDPDWEEIFGGDFDEPLEQAPRRSRNGVKRRRVSRKGAK